MNKHRIKLDKNTLILLVLAIAWMTVIFFFSSQPGEDSARQSGRVVELLLGIFNRVYNHHPPAFIVDWLLKSDHFVRKGGHVAEYMVLGVLVINLLKRWDLKKYFIISLSVCFIYASSDEVHQLFVPGRAGRVSDVLLDTAAALVGMGIVAGLRRVRKPGL
ncbi:MAG: VanZ family protein [Clostridiales bacterium]|jgi:VanZ family protein|nr:VanZ family protein [Eubacteriales bacterium]MDH7565706.1 VanZ family protein [Clostridiales bacterium]